MSAAANFLDFHGGDEPMVAIPARLLTEVIFNLDFLLPIQANMSGCGACTEPSHEQMLVFGALLEAARRHDGSDFQLDEQTAEYLAKAEAANA